MAGRGIRASKKKRGSVAKKPPLGAGVTRGLANAVNKKVRRPKMNGINTISHDEENYNPNNGFRMADNFMGKKNLN